VTGISPDSIATIMSATNASGAMSVSGGIIGGDINVVGSKSNASVTGGTVGGTSNTAVILAQHTNVVSDPEFPTFETDVFKSYATTTYAGQSSGTLKNVRIPKNYPGGVKFTGNVTIQGILYIESPNNVQFRGNTNLQGFIVFENAGTVADNVIDMSGNFSQGTLPSGSDFDSLRTITGIAVLAPTTALSTNGSVDSQVRGNMILGTFVNGGSADLQIDQGTLMTLDTTTTAGAKFNAKTIKWTATGKTNQPSAGVSYDTKFVPVAGSYRELN
jgi:hypothetical protein